MRDRLAEATEYRKKIFHGQLTDKELSRDDLIALVADIRKWCSLLASSCLSEFGYDGFARNSYRKCANQYPWKSYLVEIQDLDAYKAFITGAHRKEHTAYLLPLSADIRHFIEKRKERMGEPKIEFVWPGLIDAIPIIMIVIILPAWLIHIVFKHTNVSVVKKFLLVPVCIVSPFIVSFLWPLAIKLSGLIKFTGPGDYQAPYMWYATELFGELSEYVWASLTTITVIILHKVVKSRSTPNKAI